MKRSYIEDNYFENITTEKESSYKMKFTNTRTIKVLSVSEFQEQSILNTQRVVLNLPY